MSTQTKTVKFQTFPEMIKFQNTIKNHAINSMGQPIVTVTLDFPKKTATVSSQKWADWVQKLPTDGNTFTLDQYCGIQTKAN
jgi:hypothetical protein